MEQSQNNPATNTLGAGVTEADLLNAIQHSGYPLQTVIANLLRDQFMVQDEWGYIDKDSRELRTIDILAQERLYDLTGEQPFARPILNLIIECKQSDLPFVFLLSPNQPWLSEFPLVAGLSKDDIEITTDDSASTWSLSPIHLLGLDKHRFIQEPSYCYTLSKGVRKGKDLELSGSESYNSVILPLIKALLHFQTSEQPPKTAVYFDAHLALGIGVLNAPMVGVRVLENSTEQIMLPWVRVVRHEYFENLEQWNRSKFFVVDIVHKDFFQTYIENHVSSLAKEFSELIIKHQQVISSGKGFIPNMNKDGWKNFEPRLLPRDVKSNASRAKAIMQNIARLATGQKPLD